MSRTTTEETADFAKIDDIEIQRTSAIDALYNIYKPKILKAHADYNNSVLEIIKDSSSYEETIKRLPEAITLKAVGPIAKAMTELSFYSYLLGRYAISQDMRDAIGKKAVMSFYSQPLLFAVEEPPDFMELTGQVLPYDKAIKQMSGRTSMGDSEFKSKYNGLYNRYFTIAGIDSANTLDQIKSIIDQSLKTGTSFGEFKSNATTQPAASSGS